MIPNWQRRRANFNHDWLKNQYMPALAKCLNLLDGRIADTHFEQTFVQGVLPQWEARCEEATQLPQDFERDMSPQRIVERMDLEGIDCEGTWLEDLTHHLWLARYPVHEWVDQAAEKAQKADEAYQQLQEALAECDDVRSAEALRPFRDEFAAFRNRCQELAKAVEQFPSEIKVT